MRLVVDLYPLISLSMYLDRALGSVFCAGVAFTLLETFSSQTSLDKHFLGIKETESLHASETVLLTLHSDDKCFYSKAINS